MTDLTEQLARDLEAARQRTLRLTDHDEPELLRQHTPLLSPLVWDLAHIGQQEDLWLLRRGDARREGLLPADVESLYDAFTHPRAVRARLPLLPPVEARSFCGEVRGRVLDRLERLGADPALHAAARACLAAACAAVPAALRPEAEALADLVDRGRCPGDALLDTARAGGATAALLSATGATP